jgi:hypothetical protein
MEIIDFDKIDDWAPRLTLALSDLVPSSVQQKLAATAPKYVEDAGAVLFGLTSRCSVITATLAWIRSSVIASYHGTRLTAAEVASIRAIGLIPLKAEDRRNRLIRALSQHPAWPSVRDQLDMAIHKHGPGGAAGGREGQVHLTLSRVALLNSFSHYLSHGSEFDQHVAHALLGSDGTDLLARDGEPMVIRVDVPGERALEATHRYSSVEEMQARGEIPNLAREFLNVWSYRLAHPEFQSRTLKIDCGLVFRSSVPAGWIAAVDLAVNDPGSRIWR